MHIVVPRRTSHDLAEIGQVKSQLSDTFEMKDLGSLHYFLWIEVIYTLEGILISQQNYVLCMLFNFGMMECKSITTPLDQNLKLRHNLGAACDATQFRQIVGSLIYLTITRPDLSYSVGMISYFMQRLTLEHIHQGARTEQVATPF